MADQKITDLTAGVTLVDADLIEVSQDVATTPASKKFTWTLVKSFLKTYFDTLYPAETKASIEAVLTGELTSHTHKEDFLKAMTLLGGDAIAYPVSSSYTENHATLLDNFTILSAVYINTSQVVTGIKVMSFTQGNFTADNFNGAGLYSLSGTVITKVAESANDANYFKAAPGSVVTIPFTSPYSATAGIYFIAYLHNRSAVVAAPELISYTNTLLVSNIYNLDVVVNCIIAGQNTLATNYDLSVLVISDTTSKIFHSWLY